MKNRVTCDLIRIVAFSRNDWLMNALKQLKQLKCHNSCPEQWNSVVLPVWPVPRGLEGLLEWFYPV